MPRQKASAFPEDPLITQKKTAVLTLTDAFCDKHLNAEYKKLTRKLIEHMAKENPSPLLRGRPENWAAGIVHAIGAANFLFDKSFKPYISAADLAAAFGVSPTTASQKASGLRDRYPLDFPATEYATKRMRDMAGNVIDTLTQIGPFLPDSDDPHAIVPNAEALLNALFPPHRSSRARQEFVDHERNVMNDFYELTEEYENGAKPERMIKKLETLIGADPDFFDTYLMLADIHEEQGDDAKAKALRETAFRRALARVTDRNGNWPQEMMWGWLENRHLIRALETGALQFWDTGETDAALDVFRKLLRSNPRDNIGARYYIVAIHRGETLEQHEAQFATKGGYLDAGKMIRWFEKYSADYPDEFTEWRKAVEANRD